MTRQSPQRQASQPTKPTKPAPAPVKPRPSPGVSQAAPPETQPDRVDHLVRIWSRFERFAWDVTGVVLVSLSVMTLQGFDHWAPYEADYFAGKKEAYRAEKARMADILIDQAEKILLPGLREAIEVKEAATPLTNMRYTANPRGAIYGWDQTLDNAGQGRFPQRTPLKNLYLAGAWTFPGGGYGACIPSGLLAFAEIMKTW